MWATFGIKHKHAFTLTLWSICDDIPSFRNEAMLHVSMKSFSKVHLVVVSHRQTFRSLFKALSIRFELYNFLAQCKERKAPR